LKVPILLIIVVIYDLKKSMNPRFIKKIYCQMRGQR
jgi:hypothetical protein